MSVFVHSSERYTNVRKEGEILAGGNKNSEINRPECVFVWLGRLGAAQENQTICWEISLWKLTKSELSRPDQAIEWGDKFLIGPSTKLCQYFWLVPSPGYYCRNWESIKIKIHQTLSQGEPPFIFYSGVMPWIFRSIVGVITMYYWVTCLELLHKYNSAMPASLERAWWGFHHNHNRMNSERISYRPWVWNWL